MNTSLNCALSAALLLIAVSPVYAGGGKQTTYLQNWGVAPQTRMYGGASIGVASQDKFSDGNATAGKIYGGIRFNQAWSLEGGYMGFGEVEHEGKDDRNPMQLSSDSNALYVAGVGYMPVSNQMEVFGKAGLAKWTQDNTKEVPRIDTYDSLHDSGTSPMLGLGAQYWLNKNMQARAEWERVVNMGDGDDFETDADSFSIGLTFSTY